MPNMTEADREPVPVQISRRLHAQEIVLNGARTMARMAAQDRDDITYDLLVSDIIRTNELQMWFAAEPVVDTTVPDIGILPDVRWSAG